MTSRSREKGVERIAILLEKLMRGGEVSPKDFSPGLTDGLLWMPDSQASLTEVLLISGPPIVPLEVDRRRIERLGKEGLVRPLAQEPSDDHQVRSPLRDVILFSLAWMLINRVNWADRLPVEEIRSIYLGYMREYSIRWGENSRKAFYLMSLGLEPLLSEETIDPLIRLVLDPLALSGTAKGFLPKEDIPAEISSKMLQIKEEFCVDLPVPKSESLELLTFSLNLSETYNELRAMIYKILREIVVARFSKMGPLSEILDQLSYELRDWSRRRRISLLGAKLRKKVLRFYALYPSAPDLWLSKQARIFRRLGSHSELSAFPWPFKERGVAFISLEPYRKAS